MSEKNSIFADTKPDVKIDAIAYNTIEKHVRQKKEHLPLAKFVTNRNSRKILQQKQERVKVNGRWHKTVPPYLCIKNTDTALGNYSVSHTHFPSFMFGDARRHCL